jgi:hypothetical protein
MTMARLTLRLPNSLHARLAEEAKREGVSMNQYVVLALGRVVTAAEVVEQRRTFDTMLQRYRTEEAEDALREVLRDRS